MIFFLSILFVGCGKLPDGDGDGDGDGTETDTEIPVISTFTLSSNSPTAYEIISFLLEGTDNTGITGWLVSESADKPEAEDAGFVAEMPTEYTLSSGYEDKTIYAWAKDAAGNVSTSSSFAVSYIEPGTELWELQFDGGGGEDRALGMELDPFGNLYVVGYTEIAGDYEWWIKKIRPDGTEYSTAEGWNKIITSVGTDAAISVAVSPTNPFDVVVVGYNNNADWWIKRFQADGTEVIAGWNKILDGNGQTDSAYDVAVMTGSNDWYVAGYGGSIDTGAGSTSIDWWLTMFKDNGTPNTDWSNIKIDSGTDGDDRARSIFVDNATGKIYAAGSSHNGTDLDIWIKKYHAWAAEFSSAEGWDKVIDAGAGVTDQAYAITVDAMSNVYVVGRSGEDWRILKYAADGSAVAGWDKTIDISSDFDAAYAVTASRVSLDVYVVGHGTNLVGAASSGDWAIKKFDSDGTEITLGWDKVFGGDGIDIAYGVAVDENGVNIYVIGYGMNLVSGTSGADWWIKKFFDDRP